MNVALLNCANPTMSDSTGLVSKIKVDKAKFKQLNCKPVGDEKLINTSFFQHDGSQESVDQIYFRGLVYRYDSRAISTIKKAGGFYPRVPRDKKHRLLASEVTEPTGTFGVSIVVSDRTTGVIATSKSIKETNCRYEYRYQYMIDTKLYDTRGLDPDYSLKMYGMSFEVCFEDPLPYESIVGYFEDKNYEVFYLNNEYQGSFSWSAENVVDHYLNPPSQNHSPVKNRKTESRCTVQ